MTKINLLVTCVGGALGNPLVKTISESKIFDYYIIGTDSNPLSFDNPYIDSFYRVPRGDDKSYIKKLLEIAIKEEIHYIIPGSDREVMDLMSQNIFFINNKIDIIAPEIDDIKKIKNKGITYETLKKSGLKTPEYTLVNDTNSLLSAINKYEYPQKTVLTKPTDSRGGRGLFVLQGKNTLPDWLGRGARETVIPNSGKIEKWLDEIMNASSQLMVMPPLNTPAYDADVLKINKSDYVVIVRKRINPSGIPFKGNVIVADEKIISYCKEVAKALRLVSLHDIDLMTDVNGDPVVLEVNPRPSGSMVASMVAGYPLVDWVISNKLNLNVKYSSPEYDLYIDKNLNVAQKKLK